MLQGEDGGQWQATIRAAAKKLIDAGARPSAVYLARMVQQVGDPALAEESSTWPSAMRRKASG